MLFFSEIMIIFNGVMITDICVIDFFNTLGLTSTTVSIVFELLGAAVAVSLIKISANAGDFSELINYIKCFKSYSNNTWNSSIGIYTFSIGALVQLLPEHCSRITMKKNLSG